jgi:uncharacterized SAM-binding protein YcdF (DUF218 family)
MAMAGPKTDGGPGGGALPAGQGRLMRRIGWSSAALAAGAVTALAIGFLWFVAAVPDDEISLKGNADGIVVFTGGASRITDAIELLHGGFGRRLLISGANPATTRGEVLRLNPEFARVVRCCIDFDRSLNTLGNAIETRRWAHAQGFHTLIVVTSSYHMPRAMAELAHQLPDVALVPFPVVTDKLKAEPWWSNGATTKLLLSEYLKYLYAQGRMRLQPPVDA